jgi:hypothetical protein
MEAAGVSEGRARVLIRAGDERLGLVSFEARAREAVRMLVAADKRGESLEAVERKGIKALVADRERALKVARVEEARVLGDAVSQHAEEVKTVRRVRQTANLLLNTEIHLLRSVVKMAEELGREMDTGKLNLKPREKVAMIRDVAQIVKATAETTRLAVMTERVILGKPLDVLGGKAGDAVQHMTPEEAGQYVELAIRAKARAARKNRMIDGTAQAVPPVGQLEEIEDDLAELDSLLGEDA